VIIHYLSRLSANVALACVYCHHHEQGLQTPQRLLGSIAKQLATRDGSFRSGKIESIVKRFFEEWKRKTLPTDALIRLIVSICLSLERRFVVVDGLDELEANARNAVILLIKSLGRHSIHALVSGRPYIFQTTDLAHVSGMDMEIKAKEEDIRAFVSAQIKQNEDLQMVIDGDGRWQARLISEITSKSAGQ
jgi:hypothetical protein